MFTVANTESCSLVDEEDERALFEQQHRIYCLFMMTLTLDVYTKISKAIFSSHSMLSRLSEIRDSRNSNHEQVNITECHRT